MIQTAAAAAASASAAAAAGEGQGGKRAVAYRGREGVHDLKVWCSVEWEGGRGVGKRDVLALGKVVCIY